MKPKETTLILPGSGRWEIWPAGANGAAASATPQRVDSPSAAPIDRIGCVGLPVRYVHALPMWIVKSDAAPLAGMIDAQIERRSLGGPAAGAPHISRLVADETARQLHLAIVLSPSLPEAVSIGKAPRFEPTPVLYPLPPDRLTLWMEEDRLVAAATRGNKLAYFQALGAPTLDDTVIAEIHCLLLGLMAEGVLARCDGVTLWEPMPEDRVAALQAALRIPVEMAPRPHPRLPGEVSDLRPPSVRLEQSAAARRLRTGRWIAIAAALYLLALAGFGVAAALKYREILALRADIGRDATEIATVRETAAHWKALEPALEPDYYPIERLFQAATLLPPEGVRLILLEQGFGALQLTGEARNAPAAFEFLEKLKKGPAWAAYQWQMPQPKLLPNGSAQFQIEGKRQTPASTPPPDETSVRN